MSEEHELTQKQQAAVNKLPATARVVGWSEEVGPVIRFYDGRIRVINKRGILVQQRGA